MIIYQEINEGGKAWRTANDDSAYLLPQRIVHKFKGFVLSVPIQNTVWEM